MLQYRLLTEALWKGEDYIIYTGLHPSVNVSPVPTPFAKFYSNTFEVLLSCCRN